MAGEFSRGQAEEPGHARGSQESCMLPFQVLSSFPVPSVSLWPLSHRLGSSFTLSTLVPFWSMCSLVDVHLPRPL